MPWLSRAAATPGAVVTDVVPPVSHTWLFGVLVVAAEAPAAPAAPPTLKKSPAAIAMTAARLDIRMLTPIPAALGRGSK
jgi:hypothetical protein